MKTMNTMKMTHCFPKSHSCCGYNVKVFFCYAIKTGVELFLIEDFVIKMIVNFKKDSRF